MEDRTSDQSSRAILIRMWHLENRDKKETIQTETGMNVGSKIGIINTQPEGTK